MASGLGLLHGELQPIARAFVALADRLGMRPTVTNTLRGYNEQAKKYREWKAGLRHYPVAPPGHSLHEKGLAFDMVTEPHGHLDTLGKIWTSLGPGFRWGGDFKPRDEIHFEFHP